MRTRSVRSALGAIAELAALSAFVAMIGLVCAALQGAQIQFAQSLAAAPASGCVKNPARALPSQSAGRDVIAELIEERR